MSLDGVKAVLDLLKTPFDIGVDEESLETSQSLHST
jgi:hypothetical protein